MIAVTRRSRHKTALPLRASVANRRGSRLLRSLRGQPPRSLRARLSDAAGLGSTQASWSKPWYTQEFNAD